MIFQREDLLERLVEYARDRDSADWQFNGSYGGVDVRYRHLPHTDDPAVGKSVLVACTLIAKVPREHIVDVMRPETITSSGPSYHRAYMSDARLVVAFGVGDQMGFVRFGRRFELLRAILLPLRWWNKQLQAEWCLRSVLRRDVPRAGDISLMVVPVDHESYELVERIGMNRARITVFEEMEGGQWTRLTCIFEAFDRVRWAMPAFARWIPLRALEAFAAAHHEEARELAGYLVVRIRKCLRGPPLLPTTWPVDASSEAWFPYVEEGEDFHLTPYLRRLLQVLGAPHVEVFSELDGRQLVFYDAVLRRTAWKQVGELVDLAFREQRPAYRRMLGGTTAPVLQVDVEPRFRPLDGGLQSRIARSASSSSTAWSGAAFAAGEEGIFPEDGEDEWLWRALPIKNTFINFPVDRGEHNLFSTP